MRNLLILCTVLLMLSAFSLVYVRQQSRLRFVALQQLERERDKLDAEWSRLKIEQATLASPQAVARVARQRLGMVVPKLARDLVLAREPQGSR